MNLFDAETVDSLTLIQNSNSECQILNFLLIFKRKNLEEGVILAQLARAFVH